ncbi:MAG: DUF99 family protein, partial [Candidatus Pacearchaeota archaeon]
MKKFIFTFEKINPIGINAIKNAGRIEEIIINRKKIYVQRIGFEIEYLKKILEITCLHANIPEPLRVSHIIATGIVRGEGKGRA